MLPLSLATTASSSLRILCLGAHADDIEIGCGGTILRLLETYPDVEVYWVVFSAGARRRTEAISSAKQLVNRAKRSTIVVKRFKDSFFPYAGSEIKGYFEQLKKTFSPDVVITHFRQDLHQDHQLISSLTWNTFRNHLILEYEIPKYDGDIGSPNLFVHLDKSIATKKVEHIFSHFSTQRDKHWFTEDIFFSLMRIRGMEGNAPDRFAEAFYCRKMVW